MKKNGMFLVLALFLNSSAAFASMDWNSYVCDVTSPNSAPRLNRASVELLIETGKSVNLTLPRVVIEIGGLGRFVLIQDIGSLNRLDFIFLNRGVFEVSEVSPFLNIFAKLDFLPLPVSMPMANIRDTLNFEVSDLRIDGTFESFAHFEAGQDLNFRCMFRTHQKNQPADPNDPNTHL